MPNVSPDSPAQFTPFASAEELTRWARGIESAVESMNNSVSTNTSSTVTLIATQIGLGGAVPVTTSTAAPVKGFFRTAAGIGVAVPSMSTNSVASVVFSVAAQVGNALTVGDAVQVIPLADWPAVVVQGNAYVVDTNSIRVWWRAISGINATTTNTVHVYTVDLT